MSEPQATARPFPLDKADLCVKCGLCLPHCPTYRETQHEADSPRGRVALMQGLASGLITDSASLEVHLDGCLGCRSCESVCPAKVPYGELIDAGRSLLAQRRGQPLLTRILAFWLRRAPLRSLLRLALRGLQWTRLPRWQHGPLSRWRSLIPSREGAAPRIGAYQAHAQPARVALFRGCVGDIADRNTLSSLGVLLQRAGLQLIDAPGQTCCGALQQHAGLTGDVQPLLQANLAAFAAADVVTYAASGCGATLMEYGRFDAGAAAFARRVVDPHRLLLERWPQEVRLKPSTLRAAVHLPCTQNNVSGGSPAMLALLQKIPGLQLLPLDRSRNCCGAAGTYFLSEPAMADRLLEHKLDELAQLKPDLLLSSNIGCSLHLAAGLRRRGLTVPVLHPLVLLAQHWPDA